MTCLVVSMDEDIAKLVSSVEVTKSGISSAIKNPNNGIIRRGIGIGSSISTGIALAKKPIGNMSNSVKEAYGSIKNEYENMLSEIEDSRSNIREIKDATVSISRDVKDFVSNSASDIKVAGSEIGDIVENGIKDIKIETKAEYEKVAGIYGKSNYENQGIEGRVIFA